MTPEARSDIRAAVVGIVIAGVSLYANNWSSDSRALQHEVQQLITQGVEARGRYNQIRYRMDQVERLSQSNQGRSRNNTENINRLCRSSGLTCSTRNALLWRPPYPAPLPRLLFARLLPIHETRRGL